MPVALAVEATTKFRNICSEFKNKFANFHSSRKSVLCVGDSVVVGVFDSIEIDDTLFFDLDMFTLCEFDIPFTIE